MNQNRKYKAIGGFFSIPFIPSDSIPPTTNELKEKQTNGVYISTDGKIYNQFYLQSEETKKLNSIPSFPNFDSYNSYQEYENACIEWKNQCENILKHLSFPKIVGKFFYRPDDGNNKKEIAVKKNETTDYTETETDWEDDFSEMTEATSGHELETNEQDFEKPRKVKKFDLLQSPKKFLSVRTAVRLNKHQEQEVLQVLEKRLNLNDSTISTEFSRATLPDSIWDSELFPEEPNPKLYKKYENYERAYKRWSQIVVKSLSQMPIHASQFTKQIRLQQAMKPTKRTEQTFHGFETNYSYYNWRNNLTNTFNLYKIQEKIPESKSIQKYKDNFFPFFSKLDQDSRTKVNNFFEAVLSNISENMKKYQHNSPEILGKPAFLPKKQPTLHFSTQNPLSNSSIDNKNRFHEKVVPNIDKLEVGLIRYDIEENINWKNFNKDPNYFLNIEQKVIVIESENAYYSIIFPNQDFATEKKFEKIIQEKIDVLLKKKNIDFPDFKDLILGKESFNQYSKIFKSGSEIKKKILNSISPKIIKKILNLLNLHPDVLIHIKIGFLLNKFLTTKPGNDFLEEIVNEQQPKILYKLSYTLVKSQSFLRQVFPFSQELIDLAKINFPKEVLLNNFIHIIYCFYYIRILYQCFKNEFQMVKFLDQLLRKIQKQIISFITSAPRIIERDVFEGVSSKSSTISSIYLFVLVNLLNCEDETLRKFFVSESSKLIQHVRELGCSRFLHVKIAAERMWEMMKNERYFVYFIEQYQAKDLLEDLFSGLEKKVARAKTQTNLTIVIKSSPNVSRIQESENLKEIKKENDPKKIEKENDPKKIEKENDPKKIEKENDPKKIEKENDPKKIEKENDPKRDTQDLSSNAIEDERVLQQEGKQNQEIILLDLVRKLSKKNYKEQATYSTILASKYGHYLYEQTMHEQTLVDLNQLELLSPTFFNNFLLRLNRSIMDSFYAIELSYVARFLMQMIHHLLKKNLIFGVESLGSKPRKTRSNKMRKIFKMKNIIRIDCQIIFNLMIMIRTTPENAYDFKIPILMCVRDLLKEPTIFDAISEKVTDKKSQKSELVSFIREFCNDEINYKFNRESWKLLYQTIACNKSFCKYLIESKLMIQFLELLAVSSKRATLNGLYYINKILRMNLLPKEKMIQIRPGKKDPSKSFERDVKLIADFFFKNSLFVRFHMLYKNFGVTTTGAFYINLVKLYRIIYESPIYLKFLKDIMKYDEYRQGFEILLNIKSDSKKNL
ncbi:sca1 complex scaffold protein scaa [Anaeramoeba ignava]|uniref:Sca1 complex scaffold protein scaa n=1 Tax=Anaeramoeba ignava TaxID=1746090 RepID=A0A9Q0RER3_ANAIG|nr:sca1 complex scaffold protein scaa [Anaeramoeba ignava]